MIRISFGDGSEMAKRRSKRYMGIREISKGVYEINFRPFKKAERIYKRIRAKSAREANDIKIRMMADYGDEVGGKGKEIKRVNFQALESHLLRDLNGDRVRKKTILRALNTFDTFFRKYLPLKYPDARGLDDLTGPIFNNYKNFVVNDLKRTGWRSELSTLKAIMNRFFRIGICPEHVYEMIRRIKKPPAIQKEYVELTKEDKRNLLDFIKRDKPRFYGVTYFLMRLGWRIEETVSVKRANIKFEAGKPISIKHEVITRKNKRTFVLNDLDEGLEKVIECCAINRGSSWLFTNTLGNKVTANSYREYLAKISEKVLGKRLTPHNFRHSLVTEAGLKRMPIRDLMAVTGHLDIGVVLSVYSHSTSKGRKSILKMSEI
ncbi:MAG: tyrosine-type recombinase/integrase [Bacteriovoracia bacterium]